MNNSKCTLSSVGFIVLLETVFASAISCPTKNNESAKIEDSTQASFSKSNGLVANSHNSGFELAGTSWGSISVASNGKIYCTFSKTNVDQGARLNVQTPLLPCPFCISCFTQNQVT